MNGTFKLNTISSTMEALKLNEQEIRHFGELFSQCDVDSSGKVGGPKASELFITSGLSTEMLHQIIEICGAKRLGHFGRSQFYIALKLIALAQCGKPLTPDNFNMGGDVPLPKFVRLETDNKKTGQGLHQGGGQLPPPPKHVRPPNTNRTNAAQGARTNQAYEQTAVHAPTTVVNNQGSAVVPPPQHHTPTSPPTFSPSQSPPPPSSPPAISSYNMVGKPVVAMSAGAAASHPGFHGVPAAAVVAPHAAVGAAGGFIQYEGNQQAVAHKLEKGWASFEDDNQGLLSEERKDWAHFTDSSKAETSSMSSETDSMSEDVWHITEEQREYYLNQFKTMQPDVRGVISGAVAKDFFEKSRLPIAELSKIWQLSDINKDGALNLDEFCTAMHLVVLRRNEVELPNHLPPSLVPYMPFSNPEEPFATDLPPGSTLKRLTPSSSSPTQPQFTNTFTIAESPTSSSVSSPGQKPTPVNFEFKPITEDGDIVHPVPLRMSPDGQSFPNEQTTQKSIQQQDPGGYNSQDLSPNDQLSPSTVQQPTEQLVDIGGQQHHPAPSTHTVHQPVPLHSRPRPTPKKAQSVPGPGGQPEPPTLLIPQPSSSQENSEPASGKTHHPSGSSESTVPVPPPRTKTHSRSSSLDAKQLLDAADRGLDPSITPPVVPPRPKDTGMTSSTEMSSSVTFPARKLTPDQNRVQDEVDSSNRSKVLAKQMSYEKKELSSQIKRQKEKNLSLSRLNSELNQELQEVMEQRIALEIQMEHLRPYGGSYL